MKRFITFLILIFSMQYNGIAQSPIIDSLKFELASAEDDTSRVWLLRKLIGAYRFNRPDSAIYYGMKAVTLARKINFIADEVAVMRFIAISHITLGNYSKAMQLDLEAIRLAEENGLLSEKIILLSHIGVIYLNSGDYSEALKYYRASASLADSARNHNWIARGLNNIGTTYRIMGRIDSAKYFGKMAQDYCAVHTEILEYAISGIFTNLGKIYQLEGDRAMALFYFRKGFFLSSKSLRFQFLATFPFAEFYFEANEFDSSAYYARKSLDIALEGNLYSYIVQSSNLLSAIYKKTDALKSLEFKEMAVAYQDSLLSMGRKAALQDYLDFDEQDRQREIDSAKKDFQYRLRMNAFLGSTFTLVVIAIMLYRNNRQKQKSKQKIENAYNRLKSTQSQLIQSEKMASLGELTAGIAHEIQNPLNFVNNFSEVSKELADELEEEVKKPDSDKALLSEIAKDISQNQEKINYHGVRASSIVKGMLEHSRTSSGQKVSTDINTLADEYLRLAYHGLRAKDKSFNADFKTEFEESLPKIKVIPQDIGRVLLNLINNAFYAVNNKAKSGVEDYIPLVILKTKKKDDIVEISVQDNGNGIPKEAQDRIFQPFFTTKPSGEGTGLGLSLSYDIIIQGHGGRLEVDTEIGQGTEFTIILLNK